MSGSNPLPSSTTTSTPQLPFVLVGAQMGVGKSTTLPQMEKVFAASPPSLPIDDIKGFRFYDFDCGPWGLSGVNDPDVDYDEWRANTIGWAFQTSKECSKEGYVAVLFGFFWPKEMTDYNSSHGPVDMECIRMSLPLDTINERRKLRGENDPIDAEFNDEWNAECALYGWTTVDVAGMEVIEVANTLKGAIVEAVQRRWRQSTMKTQSGMDAIKEEKRL